MANDQRYASPAELKSALGISDTTDDRRIGAVLDAISRAIDEHCGWRFYTTDSDETRYYTAEYTDVFYCVDPIVSLTTLATDSDADRTWGTEWESTDYDLMPFNAEADGEPYRWIETTPDGDYPFVTVAKGLKLTGTFGWPSVPDQIREATLLCAEKLFKRKDAVFGVMGVTELGIVQKIIREDSELALLLTGDLVRRF